MLAVVGLANPLAVAQLPTLPTLIDSITGTVQGGLGGYALDGNKLSSDGTYLLDESAGAAITIDTTYTGHVVSSVQIIVRPETLAARGVEHPDFSFQLWTRFRTPAGQRYWDVVASTAIYTKTSAWASGPISTAPGVPLTFQFEQEYTLVRNTVNSGVYYFVLNPGEYTLSPEDLELDPLQRPHRYAFCGRPTIEGYRIPDGTTTSMAVGFVSGNASLPGAFPEYSFPGSGGIPTSYPQIIINPQFVPEPIAYPLGLGALALGVVLVRRFRRGRA